MAPAPRASPIAKLVVVGPADALEPLRKEAERLAAEGRVSIGYGPAKRWRV